jgi:HlyD family secretion protein
MKVAKVVGVILVLGIIIALLPGCKSKANVPAVTTQAATVTRGDIKQQISAAGNLNFSKTEDLAFDVGGYVASVSVTVGQTVKKGQVLASLDTTQYNQNISNLQNAVTVAQHALGLKQTALTTAQRGVTTAQNSLTDKQRAVQTAQLAVQSAQLTVESANNTLYSIKQVSDAQNEVDTAQSAIKQLTLIVGSYSGGGMLAIDATNITYWQNQLISARAALVEAQANLRDVLNNTGITLTTDVKFQITQAKLNLVLKQQAVLDAQHAVDNAQHAVDDAQYAVTLAQQAVDSANYDVNQSQISLKNAQQNLDQANAQSPNVVAPFDGFISTIAVSGGDQVYKGSVAMTIDDPTQFETQIFVSEMNISNLTVGMNGTLTASPYNGVSFPVQVTYVSPTATISSSVVNYAVKVAITSLTPIATTSTLPNFPGSSSGNFTFPGGNPGSGSFTPPTSGTFTRPTGTFTPPSGGFTTSGNNSRVQDFLNGQGSRPNALSAKQYPLRSGMGVTVTLSRTLSAKALIVPTVAIKTAGGKSTVTLQNADGTTTNQVVTTGNADYTNTEITSGLKEGDKVVISSAQSSKATTTTRAPNGGGGVFFGGR